MFWTMITFCVPGPIVQNLFHCYLQALCKVNKGFLKMGQTRSLFLLFLVFSKKQYNFYNNSMCPSSIWHRDSNPQPFEHESSPITTRPGLPHCNSTLWGPEKSSKTVRTSVHHFHKIFAAKVFKKPEIVSFEETFKIIRLTSTKTEFEVTEKSLLL